MKLLLLTLGTRGDVQPFIALGHALAARGESVTLCANAAYGPLVSSSGLAYTPLSNELLDLADRQSQSGVQEGVGTAWQRIRAFKPIFARLLQEQWQAAQGFDAIIYHPQAIGGHHLAEALGIPGILADPLPMYVPTGAFPHLMFPPLSLGPLAAAYNRWTYSLIRQMLQLSYGGVINRWRRETLGLGRFDGHPLWRAGVPVPVLQAYSPSVLPRPADWPSSAQVTGYWFWDAQPDWTPPPALAAFLAAGSPPVYIGFGSLGELLKAAQGPEMLAALQATGQRFILAKGWLQNVGPLGERFFEMESVPHDWLFPRLSAVVHHGGAGTTAAALRAGKPAVVCPLTADQPFWARRMQQLGVAPAPLPLRRLTPTALVQALKQLRAEPAFAARANDVGAQIRAEDGVGVAAARIAELLR
ncbi:MAG: glycosyltransferase [Candidatus Sericytochromatia bacterium]